MHRRDFLLFRSDPAGRIVELSCERLYMRYVDASLPGAASDDPCEGEPPRNVKEQTTEELFRDLDGDLRDADIVRLVDTRWLASEDFGQHIEAVLDRFRARGGKVI